MPNASTWWTSSHKIVLTKLTRIRNNAISMIKKKMYGKFYIFSEIIFYIHSHMILDFFLLSLDNENEFDMPSVDQIFFLRKNRTIYRWFCNNILSEVIGNVEFQKLMKYELLSKFVTVSDEAFALLCFKNYYAFVHYNVLQKEGMDDEDVEKLNKKVAPLYTKQGATRKSRKSKGCFKYSGWTMEGMMEYNELMDKIRKDRSENEEFDNYLLMYNIQKNKNMQKDNVEKFKKIKNFKQDTSWDEFTG